MQLQSESTVEINNLRNKQLNSWVIVLISKDNKRIVVNK